MGSFRTEVLVPSSACKIKYSSKVLFMGSCFAQNIGNLFQRAGLEVCVNPMGIVYNPRSLQVGIERIVGQEIFEEKDLFFANGMWNSFLHHSSFSHDNADDALLLINNELLRAHEFLKSADFVFFTFGTANIYENASTGDVVSNCHKLPSSQFYTRRLSVEEIVEQWKKVVVLLKSFNPKLEIVFTISPVRHWRDGAHGNQLSKAVLLLSIEQIISGLSNCHYFPAYEILLDDLRDYRFFKEDMLHPGKVAIDYVWEKLSDCFFDDKCVSYIKEVDKLSKAKEHRPFRVDSEEYQDFLNGMLKKIGKLEARYPEMSFELFKTFFCSRLRCV